jgi:hypothetical protein
VHLSQVVFIPYHAEKANASKNKPVSNPMIIYASIARAYSSSKHIHRLQIQLNRVLKNGVERPFIVRNRQLNISVISSLFITSLFTELAN